MRIGLHARNDTAFTDTDYQAIRTARIETLKIMDFTQISVLQRLRSENPGIEFIVRLFDDRISGSHTFPTPSQFVAKFAPRINELRAYATKFEIHNEPNHYQGIEGWGNSDADARDFRLWYLTVLAGLRQACPWASFGFPGLALNYPHRDMEWLDICRDAILASDWLGCHTYWQYGNMFSTDWGLRFIHYRQRFPSKMIEITEFANSTPSLPRQEMATQYAAYYRRLQQYPYVRSASSFICSSPDPTWLPFAWCDPPSNTIFPVVNAVAGVQHQPPAPDPVYRVSYLSHDTPPAMSPGQKATVSLRLRNDGNVLWPAGGDNAVRLGQCWLPAGAEGGRVALPADTLPGQTQTLTAAIQAPAIAGDYTLRWDLIEDKVGWFADRGVSPLDITVQVKAVDSRPRAWTATASHNTEGAGRALDGDPATMWSSGVSQQPGMWFMVDLGRVQLVGGVKMASPDKDFPRGFVVELSSDGAAWREAARKDPNWKSVDAAFDPAPARFVRVTQTRTPRWPVPWSISEVAIAAAALWTATADPNPDKARLAIDSDEQTAWTTVKPQRPGAWFQLDLGEKQYVGRLRLSNTSNPQYPRGYVIMVSVDGVTWEEAARKLVNWRSVDVSIGPRWARHIRIEQTGVSPWHPWAIAEITISTVPAP